MVKEIRRMVIGAFALITMLSIPAWAQNSDANKYIIDYKDSLYTFELTENTNSCTIKCSKNGTKAGADDSCSILSMYNISSLLIAIKKVNSDIDSDTAAKEIASKLLIAYNSQKTKNGLNAKIASLSNDKAANIAVLRLKGRAVNAYMFPLKEVAMTASQERKMDIQGTTISRFSEYKELMKNSPETLMQSIKHVVVDSISMALEDGIIKDIHVISHSGNNRYYFINKRYIPIRNGQDIDALSAKGITYLPFLYSRDSILMIDLSDILDINRRVVFASGTYTVRDTLLTVSSEYGVARLYKPKITESFDVRIFSDFAGYDGSSPNGIIQAEAQLNFILNQGKTQNTIFRVWNTHSFLKNTNRLKYRQQWVWFNRISPYIKLTKIEKTGKVLPVDTSSSDGRLIDLYRYSYINVGTDLNFLTFRTDSKLFSLNLAGGILRTKIGNDTIADKSIERSTVYLNPNLLFKFYDSNKIDFDLRIGAYGAWIVSPVNSSDLAGAMVFVKKYAFDITHWWGEFHLNIGLHPNGNKQNSFFIRASEFYSTKENYFTFQAGYSTSFSNLLNF